MSMLGLTLKAFFARRVPPRVLVAIAALRGDSIVSDVHIDTDGVIVQDSGRLHVHESTCGGMRIASTSVTVTGQIQIVGDQGAVKHDVDHWWTCECKGCRGIVSIASDGRDVTEVSRFWRVLGDRPTTMWDAAQRWAQLLRRNGVTHVEVRVTVECKATEIPE